MKEAAKITTTRYSLSSSSVSSSFSGFHLPIWSPSYDGVVVHSFVHRMRDYLERMSRYQLLYGVATAEAANIVLNEKQIQFGLDRQVTTFWGMWSRTRFCLLTL